jgi:hypothetical protein
MIQEQMQFYSNSDAHREMTVGMQAEELVLKPRFKAESPSFEIGFLQNRDLNLSETQPFCVIF